MFIKGEEKCNHTFFFVFNFIYFKKGYESFLKVNFPRNIT